jgi:hypothetical protein
VDWTLVAVTAITATATVAGALTPAVLAHRRERRQSELDAHAAERAAEAAEREQFRLLVDAIVDQAAHYGEQLPPPDGHVAWDLQAALTRGMTYLPAPVALVCRQWSSAIDDVGVPDATVAFRRKLTDAARNWLAGGGRTLEALD